MSRILSTGAAETATAADGTHPTGMHSCVNDRTTGRYFPIEDGHGIDRSISNILL